MIESEKESLLQELKFYSNLLAQHEELSKKNNAPRSDTRTVTSSSAGYSRHQHHVFKSSKNHSYNNRYNPMSATLSKPVAQSDINLQHQVTSSSLNSNSYANSTVNPNRFVKLRGDTRTVVFASKNLSNVEPSQKATHYLPSQSCSNVTSKRTVYLKGPSECYKFSKVNVVQRPNPVLKRSLEDSNGKNSEKLMKEIVQRPNPVLKQPLEGSNGKNSEKLMKEIVCLTKLLKERSKSLSLNKVNQSSQCLSKSSNVKKCHKGAVFSKISEGITKPVAGTEFPLKSFHRSSDVLASKTSSTISNKNYFIPETDRKNLLGTCSTKDKVYSRSAAFHILKNKLGSCSVILKTCQNNTINQKMLKTNRTVQHNSPPRPILNAKLIRRKSLNSVKNDPQTKLISSKYKVVNKTLSSPSKPITSRKLIRRKSLNSDKNISQTKLISSKYKVINKTLSTPSKPVTNVKLIRKKSLNSVKNISQTKLISSKYKVINKTLSTPSKSVTNVKLIRRKSLNSAKKVSQTKLMASKYKVVNKNLSPTTSFKTPTSCTFSKKTCSKNSKIIHNAKPVKSKYKLVNSNEANFSAKSKSPSLLDMKKSELKWKKVDLSRFLKSNTIVNKIESKCMTAKSPKTLIRQNKNSVVQTKLNVPCKKHSTLLIKPSALNSRYKVLNKSLNSQRKLSKSSAISKTSKCDMDVDLLMELVAEKKRSEKKTVPKPVLLKRVYKSKNVIINKNVSFQNSRTLAKKIKSKYSVLNKTQNLHKQLPGRRFTTSRVSGYHTRQNFRKTNSPRVYQHKRNLKFMTYHRNNFSRGQFCRKKSHFRSKLYSPSTFTKRNKLFNKYTKYSSNTKLIPPSTIASRVLNRSISTALTSLQKKQMSKLNTYCMFYNRFGRCNKGVKCPYVHDPSKIAVCTRFVRGTCKNDRCPFSHEICPGKMAICSFFLLGSCTKENCPYRHEELSPDAKLCKGFVQGYCPKGKMCKDAHVLVCPRYIQGCCDKGNACAFPHPPQREKKHIPKNTENSKSEENTDDLVDKVSRYFQPLSGSASSSTTGNNMVVRRTETLPVQPSYIALSFKEDN